MRLAGSRRVLAGLRRTTLLSLPSTTRGHERTDQEPTCATSWTPSPAPATSCRTNVSPVAAGRFWLSHAVSRCRIPPRPWKPRSLQSGETRCNSRVGLRDKVRLDQCRLGGDFGIDRTAGRNGGSLSRASLRQAGWSGCRESRRRGRTRPSPPGAVRRWRRRRVLPDRRAAP
jgi:hypothetical protein